MTSLPLHSALELFDENLTDIRLACVLNAEAIVSAYSPYAELDIDQEITPEGIHLHANFVAMEEKLKPILNNIKRIDSYRYFKDNPNQGDILTDAEIDQAKSVGEDWFISEANLGTKKPHVGFCFAHHDKNASLMLIRSKKTGHLYLKCFPCGKAWNSVDFLMERDNLSFMEAVRKIINK
jgi:hypothetical protein